MLEEIWWIQLTWLDSSHRNLIKLFVVGKRKNHCEEQWRSTVASLWCVMWNSCGCEELRKKEVVAAARVTSPTRPLLGRWLQTSTRSLVYVTPAHSVGVCFVGGGIVAVTSVSRSAGVERRLPVRCVRRTRMLRSTAEALGWQVTVSCVMCCWTWDVVNPLDWETNGYYSRHWQRYSLTKTNDSLHCN